MHLVRQTLHGVLQTPSEGFELVYIGHKQTHFFWIPPCSWRPSATHFGMQADQMGFHAYAVPGYISAENHPKEK